MQLSLFDIINTAPAPEKKKSNKGRFQKRVELKEDFVIFFDNAGGITLQTKNYCHFYQDPKNAATDVQHLLTGDFTKYWDGNEPDHRLEAADVEHSKDDIIDFLNNPLDNENHTGAAELEFFRTLHS